MSVAGHYHSLPTPFHVLATQNPLEQEGTYPLPEAQLDRFFMQVDVDYPDIDAERRVLLATTGPADEAPRQVMNGEQLLEAQRLIRHVPVGESVVNAILELVRAGRPETSSLAEVKEHVSWGPGPRASQALMLAVRARAVMLGRLAPSLDDIARAGAPGPAPQDGADLFGARRRYLDRRDHRPAVGADRMKTGGPWLETERRWRAPAKSGAALLSRGESLAAKFPPLLVAAERVAATVSQGVHGRRRVGHGETFWQFRQYGLGDAAQRIDWRQSAKSDRVYVRETEWEAAQSVWLWRDGSPSMRWSSIEKSRNQARAGRPVDAGAGRAARPRRRASRSARAVAESGAHRDRALGDDARARRASPPPICLAPEPLPRYARMVLFGDFFSPLDEVSRIVSSFRPPRRARPSFADPRSRRGNSPVLGPGHVRRQRE